MTGKSKSPEKKKIALRLAVVGGLSLLFMLIFPQLIVNVVKSDMAMGLVFIFYYGINPFFVVSVGAYAGRNPKQRWYLPAIPAVLYPFLAGLPFGGLKPSYFQAAGLYLLLGAAAMGLSVLFSKLEKRR